MLIQLIKTIPVKSKMDILKTVKWILKREAPELIMKEHAWGIGLDNKGDILYVDLISLGTLNYNLVHPREVYRPAVLLNCGKIIFLHNHPSGCPDPSDEDKALTKRLKKAGMILEIELVGSMVFNGEKLTSINSNEY